MPTDRERVIQAARASRHLLDGDVDELRAALHAQQRIGQHRTARRGVQGLHHVLRRGDGHAVHLQQDVARTNPGPRRRRVLSATSRATRSLAVARHSTPSSISVHVARTAMFMIPRHSSTATTSSCAVVRRTPEPRFGGAAKGTDRQDGSPGLGKARRRSRIFVEAPSLKYLRDKGFSVDTDRRLPRNWNRGSKKTDRSPGRAELRSGRGSRRRPAWAAGRRAARRRRKPGSVGSRNRFRTPTRISQRVPAKSNGSA